MSDFLKRSGDYLLVRHLHSSIQLSNGSEIKGQAFQGSVPDNKTFVLLRSKDMNSFLAGINLNPLTLDSR